MGTKDLEKVQAEQLITEVGIGNRYIHKKTTSEYIVVNISKMKHPDTGEWIPAVFYAACDNTTTIWCRTVDDFKEHFAEFIVTNDEIYL